MTGAEESRAAALRVGIDLGGTKIAGIVLDASGAVRASLRVPAPQGEYRATVRAICDTVVKLEADAGGRGTVGLGMPGSISPATGRVQNANSTWLNGQPLREDLISGLERPVRLANDANCFALSEAVDGAGAGARSVFGVILGTGCGGGLVYEGLIIDGPNAIGGEWGHNPLPWPTSEEVPGPTCWCGRPGCLETWIAGPALSADHRRATGANLTSEDIVARAGEGDEAARATLDRHAGRVARGLAHVANIFDPERIVLGGGLSNLQHLYTELPQRMAPYVFADMPVIDIRPPRWGDASGVRGAAWLWD